VAAINPYLNFAGNTEEAFNFYKSVFGGEFLTLQRFKDGPHADQVPENARDKIMHVALPIGKGNILAILPDVTHYEMAMSPKLVETALPFLNAVLTLRNNNKEN
jgi:uncharacterized glyoxalase superfamily protein PhnB